MKEHKTLTALRTRWVGKRVTYSQNDLNGHRRRREGVVDGVGDDGHACDFDARRSARPTGMLFVKRPDGTIDTVLSHIVVPENPLEKFFARPALMTKEERHRAGGFLQ